MGFARRGFAGGFARRAAFGLAAGALFLAAEGHAAADCPEWTRGKAPTAYPPDRFVVGIGVAPRIYDPALGEAPGKDAAQIDIAKQLFSRVEGQTEVNESSRNGVTSLSVKQRESVATSLVGPGARAVERFLDWKNTTFYVLAVLDRKEASTRMLADLAATNRRGAEEMSAVEQALTAGHPLDAVGPIGRAVALHATLDEQATVLRALTVGQVQAPAEFAARARLSELEGAVREKTSVAIVVDDPTGVLAPELAQTLSRRHIEIAGDQSKAIVELGGKVESVRVERSQALGVFVAQARVSVAIRRRDTGTGVRTVVREGKGAAPSEEAARRKAAVEAVKAAIPAVDKELAPLLAVSGSAG